MKVICIKEITGLVVGKSYYVRKTSDDSELGIIYNLYYNASEKVYFSEAYVLPREIIVIVFIQNKKLEK